nr:FHA domain-containing protein [Myxacorys almedinensis]
MHPVQLTPVQHWTFETEPILRIGRSTENHVVLYSAVVSRYHVEMQHVDSGWQVVSLGANGTYVDGKRIAQVSAQDGMIIRLARSGPNIQIHFAAAPSERDKPSAASLLLSRIPGMGNPANRCDRAAPLATGVDSALNPQTALEDL